MFKLVFLIRLKQFDGKARTAVFCVDPFCMRESMQCVRCLHTVKLKIDLGFNLYRLAEQLKLHE